MTQALAALALIACGCVPTKPPGHHPPDDTDTGGTPDSDTDTNNDTDTDTDTDTDSIDSDSGPDTGYISPCDPTSPWKQVSAGFIITCGVHEDGCAQCWGQEGIFDETGMTYLDYYGYVDYGEGRPPEVPFQSVSVGRVELYGEQGHACGILLDGTVTCWGDNNHGQTDAPEGVFTKVEVGLQGTCGLRTDGSLSCWGQLADSDYQENPLLSAGPYADLSLSGVYLGVISEAGAATVWDFQYPPLRSPVTTDGPYSHLDATTPCAIRTDGTLDCWYLSDPEAEVHFDPLPEGKFSAFCRTETVPACALDPEGYATCFGWYGEPYTEGVPTVPLKSITCGYRQICGINLDGAMACWGNNNYGEASPPPPTF